MTVSGPRPLGIWPGHGVRGFLYSFNAFVRDTWVAFVLYENMGRCPWIRRSALPGHSLCLMSASQSLDPRDGFLLFINSWFIAMSAQKDGVRTAHQNPQCSTPTYQRRNKKENRHDWDDGVGPWSKWNSRTLLMGVWAGLTSEKLETYSALLSRHVYVNACAGTYVAALLKRLQPRIGSHVCPW